MGKLKEIIQENALIIPEKQELELDTINGIVTQKNKNQHFRIVKIVKRKKVNLPSGYVQIKGKGNLCIHAAARYKRVKQGPCNSSRNALWKFAKQGDAFIIQNKGGMVLHLKKSNRNGVHLKMNQRSNSDQQKFYY